MFFLYMCNTRNSNISYFGHWAALRDDDLKRAFLFTHAAARRLLMARNLALFLSLIVALVEVYATLLLLFSSRLFRVNFQVLFWVLLGIFLYAWYFLKFISIMETTCCGISFRSAALILLSMNLIFNVWELFELIVEQHSTYKQFLKDNATFIFLDLCLLVLGAFVFMAAITLLKTRRKSSITLLTAAVLVSLLDVSFLLYGMILLNSDSGGMGKILHINERLVLVVYALMLVTMAFKFYSALVFHNCKVELKQSSHYDAPPPYNSIDKEANSSGPPAYGENFQYAAPLLKFALYLSKCINE